MLAVKSITFFFLAEAKRSLYEINRNNRANATRGPNPVQKMFREQTKAMLDQRGEEPGPGPVLTLLLCDKLTRMTSTSYKVNFQDNYADHQKYY